MDVDELSSDMGHAGDLADGTGAVEVFEPGISIGVHPAVEPGEMNLRVLALAITGVPIPVRGRGIAAPRPFVAGKGPKPCGLGLAVGQHADRRVIGKDRLCRQDVAADGIGQRLQQGCRLADPIGQGRSVEVEAFTVEDLALTVKRQMIGIFSDQNMGQQTRTGAATLDRAGGQRGELLPENRTVTEATI